MTQPAIVILLERPDGTRKSEAELRAQFEDCLRRALIAHKPGPSENKVTGHEEDK